jgi:hypothetical protein
MLEIDRLAGWPDGYTSKIFASRPKKKLGNKSWPLALAATGTKLLLVVDEELARIKNRLDPGHQLAIRCKAPLAVLT